MKDKIVKTRLDLYLLSQMRRQNNNNLLYLPNLKTFRFFFFCSDNKLEYMNICTKSLYLPFKLFYVRLSFFIHCRNSQENVTEC